VNLDFERPSIEKFIHTFYTVSARKCWSQAYLFDTLGVAATQQARNRREIEVMLESTINEVVDSFIPWRAISQAYFRGGREEAPAPPPVKFEEKPTVVEFDDEDEEPPEIILGEDVILDDEDDASVNTEDELLSKTKETVALNL
jgi:hypothetical protein